MSPQERDEYDLFLRCLKANKQIEDYSLSADGNQVMIQPVAPCDFIVVDFTAKDKDVEEFDKNYLMSG